MRKRCESCRVARAKCDLSLPKCGRCDIRNLLCNYPKQNLVWRTHTVIGSRRARSAPSEEKDSDDLTGKSSRTGLGFRDGICDGLPGRDISHTMQLSLPHLSQPPFNSPDERAVGRFFQRWALHPCNHNIAPGYLHFLPDLYSVQSTDGALRLALESVANAELAVMDRQGVFVLRSQQKYTSALRSIHDGMESPDVDESLLLAVLIIDSFESLHKNVYAPLGRYISQLSRMLTSGAMQQLSNPRRLFIWRLLLLRIGVRQLLLNEPPVQDSLIWFSVLTNWRPDSHVARDIWRIISINAEAKKILSAASPDRDDVLMIIQQAETMNTEIVESAYSTDTSWQPQERVNDKMATCQKLPKALVRPRSFSYHDLWAARTWNYHRIGRIVLQEMLIRLRRLLARLDEKKSCDLHDKAAISMHFSTIRSQCQDVLDTMPTLLGLSVTGERLPRKMAFAKEVGILFVIVPMSVITHCLFARKEHREDAAEILEYVKGHASGSWHAGRAGQAVMPY